MTSYLVTREGRELGTFKASKIAKGLKTGFFLLSDLGWREGSGWQGLAEIVAPAASHLSHMSHTGQNPPNGVNPYTASVYAGGSGVVPPEVMEALAGTRGWVRLIAIGVWAVCSLLLMLMACSIYFIVTAPQRDGTVDLPLRHLATSLGCGFAALLLIYPALKLSTYAANMARLAHSRSVSHLAAALDAQRRFWKFGGVLTLLGAGLALLLGIASLFFRRAR